jgi:hypothetical protein
MRRSDGTRPGHAAHFALWGRPHLLERSLPWYQWILPVAQATASRQGYRWGWDYQVLAMCAALLGNPTGAVDGLLLLMPRNAYLPNGHNMQVPSFLPLYLPGNSGLLLAVALMVANWDGGPARSAPGFPDDGTWVVQAEGLTRLP